MNVKPKIAIIGAGLMGHGIAQVFAARGYSVAIQDAVESSLQSVPTRVAAVCHQLGQNSDCTKRISMHLNLKEAVQAADFVIEAISEKLAIKQDLFATLIEVCHPDAVLATNSSVIPVGMVTTRLPHHEARRVIGMHFWNPPYLIPLVEVIQSERTDDSVVLRSMELLAAIGKTPVHVRKDVVAGNRIQHALWREALAIVDEGICDAATIDTIIKNTLGLRLAVLGPLENADLVGLDLTLDIHKVIMPNLNSSPEPIEVLKSKVTAGKLGMKTGSGFYDWTPESCDAVRERLAKHLINIQNGTVRRCQ